MHTAAKTQPVHTSLPRRALASSSVSRTVSGTATHNHARHLWTFIYIVSIALIIAVVIVGYDYYDTPYTARPRHADYATLRPAGSWGLVFGVAGSLMMTLMLLYSVRKRAKYASRWGSLRQWLNLHIYLGIMGPLLIVLHTSFKVHGLVALSFWSMVGVALSGFFGRYLYHHIPRGIQGAQLSSEELEQQNQETAQRLRAEFGLPEETIARIDQMSVAALSQKMGLFRLIVSLIKSDLETAMTFRVWQSDLARTPDLPEEHLDNLMKLTRARLGLKRRILLLGQVREVLHYWHVIHKPFAIVMYVIMVVHITVAMWTGSVGIL